MWYSKGLAGHGDVLEYVVLQLQHGCFYCSISVIKLIDYVSWLVARACLATKLLGCYDGTKKTSYSYLLKITQ